MSNYLTRLRVQSKPSQGGAREKTSPANNQKDRLDPKESNRLTEEAKAKLHGGMTIENAVGSGD